MMGFPSRTLAVDGATVCACHSRPVREGYNCTRCGTKVCRLPAECPACGLVLILSTHLARSYHHLFPLRNWVEVPWSAAGRSYACYACLAPFPERDKDKEKRKETADNKKTGPQGVSESGRYACEACGNHFCIDCDVYAHEVVHNSPGCQGNTMPVAAVNGNGNSSGNGNGNGSGNDNGNSNGAGGAYGETMAID